MAPILHMQLLRNAASNIKTRFVESFFLYNKLSFIVLVKKESRLDDSYKPAIATV